MITTCKNTRDISIGNPQMAVKISEHMIARITQVMHRQAVINAEQVAGKARSLKHIILGMFCTCLYLLAVVAAVFAVSPILLS